MEHSTRSTHRQQQELDGAEAVTRTDRTRRTWTRARNIGPVSPSRSRLRIGIRSRTRRPLMHFPLHRHCRELQDFTSSNCDRIKPMNALSRQAARANQTLAKYNNTTTAARAMASSSTAQKTEWLVILPDQAGALERRMSVRPYVLLCLILCALPWLCRISHMAC